MRLFKTLADRARRKAEDGVKRAVAVSLQPATSKGGGRVPVAVAKGEGASAEEILKLAEEHDVPVREDAELAALLMSLEAGEQIPEELYRALAAIFACLKEFDQRGATPQLKGYAGTSGVVLTSIPTGQWSEPMTSGEIQQDATEGTSPEVQKK